MLTKGRRIIVIKGYASVVVSSYVAYMKQVKSNRLTGYEIGTLDN